MLTIPLDQPVFQAAYERMRAESMTLQNHVNFELQLLLVASAIDRAVELLQNSSIHLIVDRDLRHGTYANKEQRERAMEVAVKWGWVEETQWKKQIAWTRAQERANQPGWPLHDGQ